MSGGKATQGKTTTPEAQIAHLEARLQQYRTAHRAQGVALNEAKAEAAKADRQHRAALSRAEDARAAAEQRAADLEREVAHLHAQAVTLRHDRDAAHAGRDALATVAAGLSREVVRLDGLLRTVARSAA